MLALFADATDFQVPGWLQVIGYAALIVAMPFWTKWLKSKETRQHDAQQTQNTGDIEKARVQTEEWVKLLDEKDKARKAAVAERRKEHERDIRRIERDLKTLHDRTGVLEDRAEDAERREKVCQEEVQLLKAKLADRTPGT